MATRRTRLSVHLAVSLLPVLALAACGSSNNEAGAMPALPVGVTTVERKDVPLEIEMVGATLGVQDVPIRARVEGFLESMNFQEGRFVKKGDLLYTIDAQPFQARLVEAQSSLAAAQTNHAKSVSDLARIRPLAEMDAVSQQDLDGAVAQEAAARAMVRASEAGVDLANIEMSYTRIVAPIAGLIGITKARPGEFVGRDPNPVVLNTLSDIDPIRVRFSISEREFIVLSRNVLEVTESGDTKTRQSNIDLVLLLADGSEHPSKGEVIASAQSINPETGTYTIEALFENPDNQVLPGQFARVRAPYMTLRDVAVVPRRAVVELQGRFQIYVVGADNTVEIREVITGPVKGNEQVIESGLDGGETIIVEGLQKVRAGTLVDPKPLAEAAPSHVLQET